MIVIRKTGVLGSYCSWSFLTEVVSILLYRSTQIINFFMCFFWKIIFFLVFLLFIFQLDNNLRAEIAFLKEENEELKGKLMFCALLSHAKSSDLLKNLELLLSWKYRNNFFTCIYIFYFSKIWMCYW